MGRKESNQTNKQILIIPEFWILRPTFHRKLPSKYWIKELIGFLIYIQSV